MNFFNSCGILLHFNSFFVIILLSTFFFSFFISWALSIYHDYITLLLWGHIMEVTTLFTLHYVFSKMPSSSQEEKKGGDKTCHDEQATLWNDVVLHQLCSVKKATAPDYMSSSTPLLHCFKCYKHDMECLDRSGVRNGCLWLVRSSSLFLRNRLSFIEFTQNGCQFPNTWITQLIDRQLYYCKC